MEEIDTYIFRWIILYFKNVKQYFKTLVLAKRFKLISMKAWNFTMWERKVRGNETQALSRCIFFFLLISMVSLIESKINLIGVWVIKIVALLYFENALIYCRLYAKWKVSVSRILNHAFYDNDGFLKIGKQASIIAIFIEYISGY